MPTDFGFECVGCGEWVNEEEPQGVREDQRRCEPCEERDALTYEKHPNADD